MFKSVLVHVDGPGAAARARLAARWAQQGGTRLIGAIARLPAPMMELYAGSTAMLSAGLIDVANDTAGEAFKEAEGTFRAAVAGTGLTAEWQTAVDFPAIALSGMAAGADALVVGPIGSVDSFEPGDLIMRAGRPVLVTPEGQENIDSSRILIAWKNTREARRAAADALPLAAAAEEVVLLHAAESSDEDNVGVDAAAAFLRANGVKVTVENTPPGKVPAAEAIAAAATTHRSGIIVLGAYGHSRLREWAFGGVTRDLLKSPPLPCLFSH